MVKFKSIFIRILSVVSVVCLVFSFTLTASAATIHTYNYEDFITNTVTTTSGKIYTANLLRDNCYWRIYTGSNTSNLLSSGYGKNFTVSAMTGTEYTFVVDPASTNSYLDLSNIPLGTSLKLSYYLNADFSFITPTCVISVLYFDSNGTYLSRYDIDLDKEGMSFPVEVAFPLNPPSGASVCRFQMKFTDIIPLPADGETNVVRELYFVMNNFDLIIPVSNDYIINNNQQQTNDKLGDLLDKQEQTNNKIDDVVSEQEKTNDILDDVVNSDPTPEKPSGSDKVDSMGDAEQNINDSVSGGYDEFGGVVDGAVENLVAYTNTFLAVANMFGLFADISMIKTLLVISLAIGFVSFLLNLSMAHASNKARESARNERKSQGHKGDM